MEEKISLFMFRIFRGIILKPCLKDRRSNTLFTKVIKVPLLLTSYFVKNKDVSLCDVENAGAGITVR
ncbi:hypothetical protein D3C72_2362230 [compost metagenome]